MEKAGGYPSLFRFQDHLLPTFFGFLYARNFARWPQPEVRMAAAYEGKTVKQWLMDLARGPLAEMEKRGILPKGKRQEPY
jgi:hypothetical protein